ncbi:hypothetical protein Dimus_005278, partial [Dionaea muscipula]
SSNHCSRRPPNPTSSLPPSTTPAGVGTTDDETGRRPSLHQHTTSRTKAQHTTNSHHLHPKPTIEATMDADITTHGCRHHCRWRPVDGGVGWLEQGSNGQLAMVDDGGGWLLLPPSPGFAAVTGLLPLPPVGCCRRGWEAAMAVGDGVVMAV